MPNATHRTDSNDSPKPAPATHGQSAAPSVLIYVYAKAANDCDAKPRYAAFTMTEERLNQVLALQSLCHEHDLTEVRVRSTLDAWGAKGFETKHRIGAQELVVTPSRFWFTAHARHAEGPLETRPIDIAPFIWRLAGHPPGEPMRVDDAGPDNNDL